MLSSSSLELSVLELQVSRSLAWYSAWSFAVQYETHETWYEVTSAWKLQCRAFILNVTGAVFQLVFNIQRTFGSKIICCQLYFCTCMYVWLSAGLLLEWMPVMLTESTFTCDLCVSGIYITQNEICLLGIPDSCYIRVITYLTPRKRSKSFEKLLKCDFLEKAEWVSFSDSLFRKLYTENSGISS